MNQNATNTKAYVDNNSTTAAPSLQSTYNPPRHRGEVGWICPVCGRGLAPSTSYCPCNLTRNITYLNGGLTIGDCTPIDCCDGITARASSYDNNECLKNQTYTNATADSLLTSTFDSKSRAFGKSTYTN